MQVFAMHDYDGTMFLVTCDSIPAPGFFEIDIEHCPHCGETMKIIAAILERASITKILDQLGLPARARPRSPAQVFDLSSSPDSSPSFSALCLVDLIILFGRFFHN